MSLFEIAIIPVLEHEGGYVNDPKDPGGETKFGISKRSYPDVDIANLTKDQAIEIYRRDFWDKFKYGYINDQRVATKVFDLAVNMGGSRANKIAQRALRACEWPVVDDGIIGDTSLNAINNVSPDRLLAAIRSEAAGRYRYLVARNSDLNKFLNGWLKRAYT